MKLYFDDLYFADYGVLLLYNIIFCLLLVVYATIIKITDRQSIFLTIGLFQFYFVFFILDSFFNFIPLSPDANLYTQVIENPLTFELPSNASGLGVRTFQWYATFVSPLLAYSAAVYTLSFMALYCMSLLNIIQAWLHYTKQKNTIDFTRLYLLGAYGFPAALFYVCAPLRESILIFGFSLALLGVIYIKKIIPNFQFIMGSLITSFIRPQVLFFIALLTGLKFISNRRVNFILKIITSISIVMFVFWSTNKLQTPLTVEYLNSARNIRVNALEKGGDTYGKVEWVTAIDIIKDIPLLTAQFTLAPLPILSDINPTDKFLAFVDSLFVLILVSFLLIHFKIAWVNYKFWLFAILAYMLLFGVYEYHLTGAVRHRIPMVLMMLCLVVGIIQKRYINYNHARTA